MMVADNARRLVQMLGETQLDEERVRRMAQQHTLSSETAGPAPDEESGSSPMSSNEHQSTELQPIEVSRQSANEDCSVQGLTNLIALSGRQSLDRFRGSPNALSRILELPMELQFMILRYLNFADLERLRRTCHFFRDKITKPMIRDLFPSLKYELLSTCYQCLRYDPVRNRLVMAEDTNERYPFANECFECVVKGPGFMVGHKVTMGDFTSLWICRWCGYPIADGGAWNQPEFHNHCYRRYHKILFFFFLVGCGQGLFVIVGSALCWSYFRKDTIVLAPTIINFFMALWVFCLTLVRNEEMRTYHFTLFLELAILGLWVPPLLTVIHHGTESTDGFSKPDLATLVFVVFNMFFRLLNVLGNMILFSEFKVWRRRRPNMPLWRRILYKIITVLIFWTYPQNVEQVYPGRWWFRQRREHWHV